MKKINMLWVISWMLSFTLHAQRATTLHTARIICHFEGSEDGDTARVEIWKYNIRTPEMRRCSMAIIRNHEVEIKIDTITYPVYLSAFYRKKALQNPELYLVEPGDNIHIHCMKDSMVFSGRGAVKMQCRYAMDMLDGTYFKDYLSVKSPNYKNQVYDYHDKSLSARLNLLTKFRQRVSPIAYKIMRVDVFAADMILRIELEPHFEGHMAMDSSQQHFYQVLYQRFCRAQSSSPANIEDHILAHSFYFTDFVLKKYLVDSFGMRGRPFNLSDFYAQVKNRYKGLLRENLLTSLLESKYGRSSDQFFTYIQDALVTVKDPELKEVLRKQYQHKVKGAGAFNFSLRDTTGKLVRLSDFRNKIVMLDLWFTGCLSCSETSTALQPVENLFKENKDVVFISISVDHDKNMWLKSVRKGWYSSPQMINLYTDQQGEEDSFIRYYDIHAYPTLMLIDRKGNLFSSALPDPRPDNGKAMISQIRQALVQGL